MKQLYLTSRKDTGFVIIEAMVALLLVAFTALAISKVTTLVLQSAGESRARGEANLLAQARMERMRNSLLEGDFNAVAPVGDLPKEYVTGATAAFEIATTVSTPSGASFQRRVEVKVAWTSANNEAQTVALSSEMAWGNADNQAVTNTGGGGGGTSAITPRGAAQRIKKDYGTTKPSGANPVAGTGDKAYVRKAGNTSELIVKVGDKFLGVLQTPDDFSKIQGRVYFDVDGKQLPAMNTFDLRLSSEGECVQDSSSSGAIASANNKNYSYFTYTCFVGTGWYGNVGLSSSDIQGKSFQTCVGDPGFPTVTKLTSPHANLSSVRTYRGFEQFGSDFLSTGMGNNSIYPNSDGSAIYGKPTPADYGYNTTGLANQFSHDFYVTSITGNATCATVMPLTIFAKNAGKYLCISPDNATGSIDQCPDVWPNFAGYVPSEGGGGGGGGSNPLCNTVISGSLPSNYSKKGKFTVSPDTKARCDLQATDAGQSYECTNITAARDTPLKLDLAYENTSRANVSVSLTINTSCKAITANF